jgi:hypothetical protein
MRPFSSELLSRVRRWLAGLGCEIGPAPEGAELRGEFSPPVAGDLVNPATGATVERVVFTVDAEGALHVCEPACLRALPARNGSLVRSLGEWCAELQAFLDKRFGEAEAACEELLGRGFDAEVSPQTLETCVHLEIEWLGRARLACSGGRLEGRWLDGFAGGTQPLDAFSCLLVEASDPAALELRIASHLERELPRPRP